MTTDTTPSPTKWALILGATSGAGAAIARSLAHEPGLDVLGMHRGNHLEEAARVQTAVEAAGRQLHYILGDAGRPENIAAQADEVLARLGPGSISMFVHSIADASVGRLASGEAWLHPKQIAKTFNCMAHSFVYWTQELRRRELLAPGARLLALDNAINESLLANLSVIAASKAALETYVRHLALELGPEGYRVNALKFGTVETAALRWIFPPDKWETVKDIHHRMHPAGRMIELDEVARFVSVLASDAGAWFNSAVIDMSGGQMHGVYQHLMNEVLASTEASSAQGPSSADEGPSSADEGPSSADEGPSSADEGEEG